MGGMQEKRRQKWMGIWNKEGTEKAQFLGDRKQKKLGKITYHCITFCNQKKALWFIRTDTFGKICKRRIKIRVHLTFMSVFLVSSSKEQKDTIFNKCLGWLFTKIHYILACRRGLSIRGEMKKQTTRLKHMCTCRLRRNKLTTPKH